MLTGFLGDKGYFVNQHLKKILPVMRQEHELLVSENQNLTDLKISYETNYQKILNEAYRYGYLQEDEFRIILNTFTSYNSGLVSSAKLGKRIIMPGSVLKQKQIVLISILSGVLINLIIGIYYILKKIKIKRDSDS